MKKKLKSFVPTLDDVVNEMGSDAPPLVKGASRDVSINDFLAMVEKERTASYQSTPVALTPLECAMAGLAVDVKRRDGSTFHVHPGKKRAEHVKAGDDSRNVSLLRDHEVMERILQDMIKLETTWDFNTYWHYYKINLPDANNYQELFPWYRHRCETLVKENKIRLINKFENTYGK